MAASRRSVQASGTPQKGNAMQSKLSSCPFCGSDNVYLKYNGAKHGRFYYVECAICGGRTRGVCRPYTDIPRSDEPDEHEWDCMAAINAEVLWERRANRG